MTGWVVSSDVRMPRVCAGMMAGPYGTAIGPTYWPEQV
jgi:hypothetical protein